MIEKNQSIRVCHASFSDISSDQRILREISTLQKLNYSICTVGYGAGVNRREFTLTEKVIRSFRQIPAAIFGFRVAYWLYWLNSECREAYSAIIKSDATIIHAHDWEVLPAAYKASKQLDATLIYDSHEIASDMRKERLLWWIAYSAFIRKLEARFVPCADQIITVGHYCAYHFRAKFDLSIDPVILRNLPHYQKLQPRKADTANLLIHYHGIINSGRGLSTTVRLLAHLPYRFRLRITGREVQAGYCKKLRDLAVNLGCLDRLEINSAVPYDDLLLHANEADIGIFIPSLKTVHGAGAAPNKLYEYMMSGLMLMSNETLEAQSLVDQYQVGLAANPNNLIIIAEKLSSLTAAEIDEFKDNSINAAKELCWENEQSKLEILYKTLVLNDTPDLSSKNGKLVERDLRKLG